MLCSRCNLTTALWAHRGEQMQHRWSDDRDERTCSCRPVALCAGCDETLLREHGFLLLDETALPSASLLN